MNCSCVKGYSFCGCCGCPNNPSDPANNHRGFPCKGAVVPGTFRCYMHGGGTAPAQAKAREELAKLRLPGIEVLFTVMETMQRIVEQFASNTCPTCGYPKGDPKEIQAVTGAAMTAAKTVATILDRTGLPPRAEISVKQSDGDIDLTVLTSDERGRMIRALAEFKAVKEEIRQRIAGVPATPANTSATPQGNQVH